MRDWTEQVESKFYIAQEDQYDALSALCQRVRQYYERYPSEIDKRALTSQTLAEALACFDWELTEDDLGNAIGITYKRHRWIPLAAFFYDMAPYIRSGSYILMRHDDIVSPGNGSVETRYTFTGATVIEEQVSPGKGSLVAETAREKQEQKKKRRKP